MLDQVKQKIVALGSNGTNEVTVEQVQGYHKITVLDAMKALQKEGKGTLIVGRHGRPTRFKVNSGPVAVSNTVDPKIVVLAQALEITINKNKDAAPEGTELVVNIEDLEKQFTKASLISAFRMLEEKGLGLFVIGRKGAKTRFEVGKVRQTKTNSLRSADSGSLPPPEDGPFAAPLNGRTPKTDDLGYRLLVTNGCVLTQFNVPGGHKTLREAFAAAQLKEVVPGGFERFEKVATRFGFVMMQPVGISR